MEYQSHLTKMGAHGFRVGPEKEAKNLEVQRNHFTDPWIHL